MEGGGGGREGGGRRLGQGGRVKVVPDLCCRLESWFVAGTASFDGVLQAAPKLNKGVPYWAYAGFRAGTERESEMAGEAASDQRVS